MLAENLFRLLREGPAFLLGVGPNPEIQLGRKMHGEGSDFFVRLLHAPTLAWYAKVCQQTLIKFFLRRQKSMV